ncbi:MAG: family 1 glycosylhydrolase [Victivallaceae bacterium]|nr:family 1 glycosylhydrolase [Victivallaceae bacterium]
MLQLLHLPKISFPENFLWGSATAAHQIEGGDDASVNNYDENRLNFKEKSGAACDHWNRYREDAQMIAQLGHNAYRMSLSWARVEPEENRFDETAIAQYLAELSLYQQLGIKVYLTMLHGSIPLWFDRLGGFAQEKNLPYFEAYLRKMIPLLKGLVDSVLIINEFNITSGATLPLSSLLHANYLKAHAIGYRVVKEHYDVPVSSAHALQYFVPERAFDRFDRQTAELMDWQRNEFFFHAIRTGEIVSPYSDGEFVPGLKDSLDYWAVNYYCRTVVSSRKQNLVSNVGIAEKLRMIDMDFYLENVSADGFTSSLVRLADKPVTVTENGICCDDDRWRILKLALDLAAMHDAMKQSVAINGYFHWSLMDNYEWTSFVPRFGLVDVDFKTQKRTPKPSAAFYREIIQGNGFSGALLRKYLPELPELKLY